MSKQTHFWLCSLSSLQASIWLSLGGWSTSVFLSRKLWVDLKQKVKVRLTGIFCQLPAARFWNCFKNSHGRVGYLLRDELVRTGEQYVYGFFVLTSSHSQWPWTHTQTFLYLSDSAIWYLMIMHVKVIISARGRWGCETLICQTTCSSIPLVCVWLPFIA